MLLHFVLNPCAGRGRGGAVEGALRREFAGREIRIAREPPLPGSRELDAAGAIVAVGGDGTVNRLLEAARARGIPLGILPCGTANDFARAMGIPLGFRRACAALREGRVLAVDLATVDGVPFATCGGIGIAAEAAARSNRWRGRGAGAGVSLRILGGGVYLLAALLSIRRPPDPLRVVIRNGDRFETARVASLLVSNQARFGVRFAASPAAGNRDGLLDLCRIDAPLSRAGILRIALGMLGSGPGERRGVHQRRGRAFEIRCERETEFFGDGEILARAGRFLVRAHPGALRVIVPRESVPSPGPPVGGSRAR